MLSRFGKTLRKIRIDHSITLGELGKAIGVSAAFLSALERGKPVPAGFVDKVASAITLTAREVNELQLAAAAQTKEVTLKMDDKSDATRELAVAFARSFDSMSDDEIQKMLEPFSNR